MSKAQFIICARAGKSLVHFTGEKFSTIGKPKIFDSHVKARARATELVGRFPVLMRANVHVEAISAYKKNPSGYRRAVDKYADELDAADARLAGFAGRQTRELLKVNEPPIRAGLVIGHLEGVMYATVRDGKRERYLHRFKKSSRPLLIAKHDGTQIGIVGGQYRFTDAGIEDD